MIRAAVIYAALLWALLQVADLLAEAEIVSGSAVRWMILLGVVGFPLTLIGSWFVESPWKDRRWTSIAGDLLIIVAISIAAILFAWQQWFQTFARPVVAVMAIEATDTREDTADLADHLTKRIRSILATQIEFKLIEISSSTHPALATMSLAEKTSLLGAEYVLTGTLSRGGQDIRLSVQLYNSDGELVWGERFEDRLIDQAQLQNRVMTELWTQLATDTDSLAAIRQIITECDYPSDGDAILALARYGNGGGDAASMIDHIESIEDNALLFLELARAQFADLVTLPPAQRPVAQQLAMQSLAAAEEECPGYPDIGLLRLENTRTMEQDGIEGAKHVAKYPNAASLYLKLADAYADAGANDEVLGLLAEAHSLDPASPTTLCRYRMLLESDEGVAGIDRKIEVFFPGGCDGF